MCQDRDSSLLDGFRHFRDPGFPSFLELFIRKLFTVDTTEKNEF